jgi:hypothetical protein
MTDQSHYREILKACQEAQGFVGQAPNLTALDVGGMLRKTRPTLSHNIF